MYPVDRRNGHPGLPVVRYPADWGDRTRRTRAALRPRTGESSRSSSWQPLGHRMSQNKKGGLVVLYPVDRRALGACHCWVGSMLHSAPLRPYPLPGKMGRSELGGVSPVFPTGVDSAPHACRAPLRPYLATRKFRRSGFDGGPLYRSCEGPSHHPARDGVNFSQQESFPQPFSIV